MNQIWRECRYQVHCGYSKNIFRIMDKEVSAEPSRTFFAVAGLIERWGTV
jgi:hypothetical protein